MRQNSQGLATVDPVITGQESFTLLPPENPPLSTGSFGYFVVQGRIGNMYLNRMRNSYLAKQDVS